MRQSRGLHKSVKAQGVCLYALKKYRNGFCHTMLGNWDTVWGSAVFFIDLRGQKIQKIFMLWFLLRDIFSKVFDQTIAIFSKVISA